jgi:hypothetical protein
LFGLLEECRGRKSCRKVTHPSHDRGTFAAVPKRGPDRKTGGSWVNMDAAISTQALPIDWKV